MKIKKICIIFLIVIYILGIDIYAKEIIDTGREWLDVGEREAASGTGLSFGTSYDKLEGLAGTLFGAGVIVVIAGGMIIGAKFMLGTAEKRAKLQQTLIIYCIGSVLILGALGIWRLSINLLEGMI